MVVIFYVSICNRMNVVANNINKQISVLCNEYFCGLASFDAIPHFLHVDSSFKSSEKRGLDIDKLPYKFARPSGRNGEVFMLMA